ncbi:MAG: T9SS type A sorting domain-containing protein, partial [Bacteroidia bacterium]|nr:T9SS type A sorting domain-containing protein [Bacteroidia bacterium]
LDASDYPYLRVELTTNDEINLSPVQLKNWFVLYEPVAEGLLLHNDKPEVKIAEEGDLWSDQFKFVNISNKNFPSSLTVEVEVFNNSQLTKEKQTFLIDAPVKHDSTIFTISGNTLSKAGLNDLSVFVNRKIVPEQYYDNNGISIQDYIEVTTDVTRPMLDVSIDGRYVRNYDYVSPNPFILMLIKDENQFLLKTDTVGVNIFLQAPCDMNECEFVRINFSNNEVTWFPATATSDFRIEYKPQALVDGDYTLRIEAVDGTGNASGEEPYQITFRIKNEVTLAFNSVFPNPSSGDFFFQFQLTGNVLPDSFSLQIFTTEGRLVQEFGEGAVKEFNIGLNEFIWQAHDISGSPLPNGLYIYRMDIISDGKEFTQQGKLLISR